jgi:hypothetical protein
MAHSMMWQFSQLQYRFEALAYNIHQLDHSGELYELSFPSSVSKRPALTIGPLAIVTASTMYFIEKYNSKKPPK